MNAPTLRRLLFAAVFVTAVVSAAFVPGDDAGRKRAAQPSAQAAVASPERRLAAREIDIPALLDYQRSREEGVEVVDIFASRLPPAPAAAPVKPEPPKLPFTYVGLIEESGRTKAVIAQGDRLHIVEKGEQLGDAYRLESIGVDQVVLTYLPLNAQQTLSPGAQK